MKHRLVLLPWLAILLWACNEQPPSAPSPVNGSALAATLVVSSDAVQVSAGVSYACALKSDGRVTCWGFASFGETAPPATVRFTHVSARAACGVTTTGSLFCWGFNFSGEAAAPQGRFTQVTGGSAVACGLRRNGTIECWGASRQAEPPEGRFTQVSNRGLTGCAIAVDGSLTCWGTDSGAAPEGQFTQVEVGTHHSCAVRADGTLACWGADSFGETVPPAGSFTQVTVGGDHSCALRADGSIACWGRNSLGQASPPAGTYTQVSAGGAFTCALRADGAVVCWGATATTEVPPAVITQVLAAGHGTVIDDAGVTVRFGFNVRVHPRKGSAAGGTVTFRLEREDVDFRSTEIHQVIVRGNEISVIGRGRFGEREVQFALSAVDGDVPGSGGDVDQFRIVLPATPDDFVEYFYDSGPLDTILLRSLEQGSIRLRAE